MHQKTFEHRNPKTGNTVKLTLITSGRPRFANNKECLDYYLDL